MSTSTADRLDPVGRLRLPRRPAVVRAALAAVLLLTAAGVLYAGGGPATTAAPSGPAEPATGPEEAATGSEVQPAAAGPALPAGPDTADPGQPDPDRLAIPAGLVGVPVPLGDPASLAVLRPGDQVDLLSVPTGGGEPAALATGAPVLAVDHAAAALLLAVTPEQGRAVVSVPLPDARFAVIVRGAPSERAPPR